MFFNLKGERSMIVLHNKVTDKYLGEISEEDLQFLIDNLEEEGSGDTDYYLNETTLEKLKEAGMNPAVAELIENEMDENKEVEIIYKKT